MKQGSWALFTCALALAACGKSSGNPACGITALAGATMLLDQFSVPEQTLSSPPRTVPSVLPVRLAAGPAWRGLVSAAADSTWIIRVEGRLPQQVKPGFGVLVVTTNGTPSGVMLYTGPPVARAPVVGSVTTDTLTVPLLGLHTNISGLEDPACPFFPDSLSRP